MGKNAIIKRTTKRKEEQVKWYYIFYYDEGVPVFAYEPLNSYEISEMQRNGVKVRKN